MADTSSAVSYTNLLAFLLTTWFYYLALKPTPKVGEPRDPLPGYKSLAIYFLLVLLIQFCINVSIVATKCGGNITENIGFAGLVTFFPWTLLFGVLIVVMMAFPNFRNIFGDVYGYFFVSGSASRLLTDLLLNKEIQAKIDADPTAATPADKAGLQSAADMIVKICGNTSVLINQLTPGNFEEYWRLLGPLMKSQYQGGMGEIAAPVKTKLYDLVVTKDNVGEATWFIYTGILLTSLVQLKISTRACSNSVATQQANYAEFQKQEADAAAAKAQATGTVYTIAS